MNNYKNLKSISTKIPETTLEVTNKSNDMNSSSVPIEKTIQ